MAGQADLFMLENNTLTVNKYRDEMLGPIFRPCASVLGPGFLLMHDNAMGD